MSDQQRQIMTEAECEALCAWLESPEGCNFQQETPGDIASMTWICDGTLKLTRQWMRAHGVDEAGSATAKCSSTSRPLHAIGFDKATESRRSSERRT